MGIKDIPLSKNSQQTTPIPKPPVFGELLQTNKGSITNDPQSGSILKVLADNGFKEKIEEGAKKGHIYTIIHSAPSPDFTLIDTWTEGTTPRKTYQFFKITMTSSVPSETQAVILQPQELEPPKIPQPLAPAHHESKSWLMEKLGVNKTQDAATPVTKIEEPLGIKPTSYDLLKQRFAVRVGTHPTNAEVVTPTTPVTPEASETPEEKKKVFLNSIFSESPIEWDRAKTIPARAFIYPTEYAWGTDASGNQIQRSLEDYPPHARKLREKIAGAIEDVAKKGVTIETATVDQALTAIFEQGIL